MTHIEKLKFERVFEMKNGYVLDFSNRTFSDFVLENTGIEIYSGTYEFAGGSKANRLREFWKKESDYLVGKLNSSMLDL